jgi:hypothetical protein
MRKALVMFVALAAMVASVGCSQQVTAPSESASFGAPVTALANSGGGTLKEILSGPAINGVAPEGQALADESQFASGGPTILTVQIRKVNLPDGTVLGVTLDFTPVGSITLSGQQGTLQTSLGHFGVSRDQVRVNNGSTTILIGGFFQ